MAYEILVNATSMVGASKTPDSRSPIHQEATVFQNPSLGLCWVEYGIGADDTLRGRIYRSMTNGSVAITETVSRGFNEREYGVEITARNLMEEVGCSRQTMFVWTDGSFGWGEDIVVFDSIPDAQRHIEIGVLDAIGTAISGPVAIQLMSNIDASISA